MSDYRELKNAFYKEKTALNKKLDENDAVLNRLKKIENIIVECEKKEDANPEKLVQLKRFFREFSEDFNLMEQMNSHRWAVINSAFYQFKGATLMNDINKCVKRYGYPSQAIVDKIHKCIMEIEEIKDLSPARIQAMRSEDELESYIRKNAKKIQDFSGYIYDLFAHIGNVILSNIRKKIADIDKEGLQEDNNNIKKRLQLIDKYNEMFSSDELLIKFTSSEELDSFDELLRSLFDPVKCKEILNMVSFDQTKEKEEVVTVTFDNLDMSKFTDDERKVIEEVREIINNEDLESEKDVFGDKEVSFTERLSIYQQELITNVLLDVKNNLINRIYEEKDEVIHAFKIVIDLYKKYILRTTREDMQNDFLRMRDDFNNIISFINKNYMDKNKAYEETKTISSYVHTIETEYVPILQELINTDYNDDDYYDRNFKTISNKFKEIIAGYKQVMSEHNAVVDEVEDIKENTNNLVFCITDDIDLNNEGFQKEFVGAVSELESKSSRELKKAPGRKGMAKIRKSTETNTEEDFADYLKVRKGIELHFVPYRHSSGSNYRTGLIKFEPSTVVKKFLEDRYGLSKQSACYGIFKVIQVIRADHSEYGLFEEYILDNYEEIEKLAKLFSSNNPNFDELVSKVDEMLNIKKEKLRNTDSIKK